MSTTLNLPESFNERIRSTFEGGEQWLAQLPALISHYAKQWELTIHPPYQLSYNYVAPVTCVDGMPAVLKLGVPRPEITRECAALHWYNGQGICRLLIEDVKNGAFLLEQLQPGRMLTSITDDEEAIQIAANVMKSLWQKVPANHPFRPVRQWADGLTKLRQTFNGETGPFPSQLVETAESLFAELFASQTEQLLLHGDLHHFNILRAGDGWKAIDPKGVVGEATYDVGALLQNPWTQLPKPPQLNQLLARRVAILAEILEIPAQRIASWGLAIAVLSGWWSYEDEGYGWEKSFACAEALLPLVRSRQI